jgi:hypothetical protein
MTPDSPIGSMNSNGHPEPTQQQMGSLRNDVKAKIVQVIEVEHVRGGVDHEPLRAVRTYWDFKGNLLAEYDPLSDMMAAEYARKSEVYQTPSRN